MVHGTVSGYSHGGCRCDACRSAMREYHRRHRRGERGSFDPLEDALSDLLHELFPNGLTPDCPRAREQVTG